MMVSARHQIAWLRQKMPDVLIFFRLDPAGTPCAQNSCRWISPPSGHQGCAIVAHEFVIGGTTPERLCGPSAPLDASQIGSKLGRVLTDNQLTIKAAASEFHIARNRLSAIIAGKALPTPKQMTKICGGTGITVEFLVGSDVENRGMHRSLS